MAGPTEDTRWSHPTRVGVPSNGETIVYPMIEPDPPTVTVEETTPGQRWLLPRPELTLHAIVVGTPLLVLILLMAVVLLVRAS